MQEEVKKLLEGTELPMVEIAKKLNVSPRTVRNINNGVTHFDQKRQYPIRVTAKRISELKEILSTPNNAAVPNPHILSPQVLDYIGFLSLLGAEVNCLLVFKDIYYKQLTKIFGRELSDKEILSIFQLKPFRPRQLSELIKAYDFPKVKLINLDYWVKQGIIKERDKEIISSLLLQR